MFNYFNDHSITTCLQSGFVLGDSTVNQLDDIYNTFCKALDNDLKYGLFLRHKQSFRLRLA